MKSSTAWDVHHVESTASTMDDARKAARAGAEHGWAVVSESMTGGRGTQKRTWHAPVGGWYASFVLRGIPKPHLVSLALGTAVADALEIAGVDARLKWVNDVWVDDRKIAGILVETEATGSDVDFVVCGIGININGRAATFPAELRESAVTLEDVLHCDSCIPDLEAILWERIGAVVDALNAGEDAAILAAWRSRDALANRRVQVDDGKDGVVGVARGVDEAGRLRVETPSGVRVFQTGTVRLA